jgi:ribosomal protein L31
MKRWLSVTTLPQWNEWFALAGGLVLIFVYAWMLDDAFVFFRYVDNLLFLGNGLVFNQGEYVEGFSSPLHCLLLIALRVFELDVWSIVRLVGVVCFVFFWLGLVVINRNLSPPDTPRVNFPLMFLCFNYPVLCYFTSGGETPLVQLFSILFVLLVIKPESTWLQLAIAVSPLVRHELALPLCVAVVYIWGVRKRFPLKLALFSALFTGSWLLFRVYYYADLLPNTFYLKDDVRFDVGWKYIHDTFSPYGLYLIVPTFIVLLFVTNKFNRGPAEVKLTQRLLMFVMALGVMLYVMKIGGAAKHYRYLAFPVCVLIASFGGICEHVIRLARLERYAKSIRLGSLSVALLALSLYPHQLIDRHPLLRNEKPKPHRFADASNHRHQLPYKPLGPDPFSDLLGKYRQHIALNGKTKYRNVEVRGRCHPMWKDFDTRIIHVHGFTDPFLARFRMTYAWRPAHKRLPEYAWHIARVYRKYGGTPGRGMFRHAANHGFAPGWVKENLRTIEIVERKAFNRHDFGENLRLAFTFPPKISRSRGRNR